jgi:hypothetical protein
VTTVLSPDLNVVPTVLLEHKAHLTENAFDRIIKEQVQAQTLQLHAVRAVQCSSGNMGSTGTSTAATLH